MAASKTAKEAVVSPEMVKLQTERDMVSDEEFQDATANSSVEVFHDPDSFDFECLSKAGSSTNDSELSRQSLYVAFDPLVQGTAIRSAPSAVAAAAVTNSAIPEEGELDKSSDDLLSMKTPSPNARKHSSKTPTNGEQVGTDVFATPPTIMSKTVTKQRAAHQEDKNLEPISGVDELLACTPQAQSKEGVCTAPSQPVAASPANRVVDQPEVKCTDSRLSDLTRQNEVLKQENETLKQQVLDLTRMVVSFEKVSKTVNLSNAIVGKPECSSEVVSQLKAEQEQVRQDLRGVELSFSDLHRRYEKLKCICDENKQTEEGLKRQFTDITDKLAKSEDRFRRLKENAQLQVDKANNEIERLQKLRETDTLGLRAQLKKQDLTIDTLQKQLEQKKTEVVELTSICDELIAKHSK